MGLLGYICGFMAIKEDIRVILSPYLIEKQQILRKSLILLGFLAFNMVNILLFIDYLD